MPSGALAFATGDYGTCRDVTDLCLRYRALDFSSCGQAPSDDVYLHVKQTSFWLGKHVVTGKGWSFVLSGPPSERRAPDTRCAVASFCAFTGGRLLTARCYDSGAGARLSVPSASRRRLGGTESCGAERHRASKCAHRSQGMHF